MKDYFNIINEQYLKNIKINEDESNFNLTDIELRNKIDVKFMLISEAGLELWEIECDKMLSLIEKQT